MLLIRFAAPSGLHPNFGELLFCKVGEFLSRNAPVRRAYLRRAIIWPARSLKVLCTYSLESPTHYIRNPAALDRDQAVTSEKAPSTHSGA